MIRSFLRSNYSALKGPARALAVLHFLDSVGAGLFITGSAVYFVVAAGLPIAQIGLGFSLAGLSGFFSTILMGIAADRIGPRRLLFLSMLALAGLYCLYPAIHSLLFFFPVVALIGALELGSGPLFHTMIMDLTRGEDRVNVRAALRSLFNVGFSVGALLGAACIGIGHGAIQLLPLGNALSFLLAAAIVLRLPAISAAQPRKRGTPRFRALKDKSFLSVIGASSLLALHSAVIGVGIPLWLIKNHVLPRNLIPLIFIVNTVVVVLFQVKAAQGSGTLDGAVKAAHKAGMISAGACIFLVAASFTEIRVTDVVVLVAVLLFTLAELWQSASAFGIGFGLAPESARGEYLGAFNIHMVVQRTVGPALVAFLVLGHGSFGWLIMGLIFLAGTAAIGSAVRWAQRDKLAASQPALRAGPRAGHLIP